MGHRQGENRHQATLFPLMLDELVGPDDLVRVIDAWISSLDLKALGFSKAQTQIMGRPPYDPADLLKLYICADDETAAQHGRAPVWDDQDADLGKCAVSDAWT